MRRRFNRADDSTFELNLAPMLDIIVSIVPMLLMSVAFVQVTMIETPVPQAVEKAMQESEKRDDLPQISVAVSSDGFRMIEEQGGSKSEKKIPNKDGGLNFDLLHSEAVAAKLRWPAVFRIELHPDESVALENVVRTMDQLRTRAKTDPQLYFLESETGKKVETDLIFPDVVFGNVASNGSGNDLASGAAGGK